MLRLRITFCVAGAILSRRVSIRVAVFCGRRSTLWCCIGAALFDVARELLSRIAVSGLRTHQKSWQGRPFVTALKSGGSGANIIFFELRKNSFIRLTRRKSLIFSFKVSGSLAQKPCFWRFKLSSWEVILAFCMARTIF